MHICLTILIASHLLASSIAKRVIQRSEAASEAYFAIEPELERVAYDDADFQTLIIGGYRPMRHTLTKYMVSIRRIRPTKYFGDNHFCAGVIVAPSWILTAAHCVVDFKRVAICPRSLIVVAGAPNRLRRYNTTLEFAVSAVIPHAKFKRRSGYDIALLRLATPIPHDNENIGILAMSRHRFPVGTNCTALGWGQLFLNGPYSAEALYVDLFIAADAVCAEKYSSLYDRGMICAHDERNPEKDLCRGDSGGPLICHHMLVGIVSWGMLCQPEYPTVFTDVGFYRKWIHTAGRTHTVRPPTMSTLLMLYLYFLY